MTRCERERERQKGARRVPLRLDSSYEKDMVSQTGEHGASAVLYVAQLRRGDVEGTGAHDRNQQMAMGPQHATLDDVAKVKEMVSEMSCSPDRRVCG